ncbi:MAG TPA: pilus assembly protein N-terminal domain-containing protein [Vicinamibacterales bacterium]|nr:pilus assembly protein N-terminal domain-containing protein [Vicinamibacterales bacterium]
MRRTTAASVRIIAAAAALVLALGDGSSVGAVQSAQLPAPQAQPQAGPAVERLLLTTGRSLPLDFTADVDTIMITDPEIADAVGISLREIMIHGKKAGITSLFVWVGGRRVEYELVVSPATTNLQTRLQALFPGEDITIDVLQGAVILSGRVSSNTIMLRAAEIAELSTPNTKVINMLQVPGGGGSQQVMLQVRFAEVNSRQVRELGASLFTTRTGFTARSTTGQFSAPNFEDNANSGSQSVQGLVFADYLNLFFFQRNEGIGAVVRALEQNGWFESLAEPNLIAYNGQEASFLAGGEVPVVFSTGLGASSVQWKEYGVKLKFKPTIAGDVIRLHVRPEVSALDFANGVTNSGTRVPALTTRYAETEIELRDGQSFAIAGLLDNIGQEDRANIPYLSKIPIIGTIFKTKANRTERRELLVLITPRLVRPLDPDEVPPLPSVRPPAGRGRGGGGVGDFLSGGAGLLDVPQGRGGGR